MSIRMKIKSMSAVWFSLLLTTAFNLEARTERQDDQQAVYQLANQCYAIKSTANNHYLRPTQETYALTDTYHSYRFSAKDVKQAAHFYFKPTAFGRYMLRDQHGDYLTTHEHAIPFALLIGRNGDNNPNNLLKVGPFKQTKDSLVRQEGSKKEWVITQSGGHFKLHSVYYDRSLKNEYKSGTAQSLAKLEGVVVFSGEVIATGHQLDEAFLLNKLDAAACAEFPEIKIESGPPIVQKGETVRGFMDAHSHLTSYEFIGGSFLQGKPFHAYGVEWALNAGIYVHDDDGSRDFIGNLQTFGDISGTHEVKGYPDFPYWPNHKSVSHQQAYYKWIERAHLAGLTMMVTHMVENQVLCEAQKFVQAATSIHIFPPKVLPALPTSNDCDAMASVDLQIQRLQQMQAYIDAQAGGPGQGFFRIVTSSEEARGVIEQGKLAVIMGIEVSGLFGCLQNKPCSAEQVKRAVKKYYNKGIRSIFPIHRFDNGFGGASLRNTSVVMNYGNHLQNGLLKSPQIGQYFQAAFCQDEKTAADLNRGFPLNLDKQPFWKLLTKGVTQYPEYPNIGDESDSDHCNTLGLSPLGKTLIETMIDKKMIIEIDHMSNPVQSAVLDILAQRGYSGVISAHDVLKGKVVKGSGATVSPIQKRILTQGGLIFPYNFHSTDIISKHKKIKAVLDAHNNANPDHQYLVGIGFGTDVNGLAPQAAPCSKAKQKGNCKPVIYPFRQINDGIAGTMFHQLDKGTSKPWDINTAGLAHYGLMPDHIESFRINGGDEAIDILFNSSEAYLQMWQRAENHQTTPTHSAHHYRQIYQPYLGKCFTAKTTNSGTSVSHQLCETDNPRQNWYQDALGRFHLAAGNDLCLQTKSAELNPGNRLIATQCRTGLIAQRFSPMHDDAHQRIRLRANIHYCLGNNDAVVIAACGNDKIYQRFYWREPQSFEFVRFKNAGYPDDKQQALCIGQKAATGDGDRHYVNNVPCDEKITTNAWHYEPLSGLIHLQQDPARCLFVGKYGEGAWVYSQKCHPGERQQWDMSQRSTDVVRFRPVQRPGHVLQMDKNKRVNLRANRSDDYPRADWKVLAN